MDEKVVSKPGRMWTRAVNMFGRHPRRLTSPYIDGELDSHEKARFERHVSRCQTCRREYERMLFASHMMSQVSLPGEAPASLLADLERNLLAANTAPTAKEKRLRLRWSAAAAIVAALLVSTMAAILHGWPHRRSETRPETTARIEPSASEDVPPSRTRSDANPTVAPAVQEDAVQPRIGPDAHRTIEPPVKEEVAPSGADSDTNPVVELTVIEAVTPTPGPLETIALKVTHGGCDDTGFCCFSDEQKLLSAIRSIPGIYRCELNEERKEVMVAYEKERVDLVDLKEAAEKVGFQVALLKPPER